MNYTYQMTNLIDLSSGQSAPAEDHDDWSAVLTGMKDFAQSDAEGSNPNSPFMRPNALTPSQPTRHIVP